MMTYTLPMRRWMGALTFAMLTGFSFTASAQEGDVKRDPAGVKGISPYNEDLAKGRESSKKNDHAGAIAHANGDAERARRHLRDALAINPEFHPLDADAASELLEDLG